MTIATVGILFPAIPMTRVALTFRYTSLAGKMRNISSQIEMPEVTQSRQNILNQELIVSYQKQPLLLFLRRDFGGLKGVRSSTESQSIVRVWREEDKGGIVSMLTTRKILPSPL